MDKRRIDMNKYYEEWEGKMFPVREVMDKLKKIL